MKKTIAILLALLLLFALSLPAFAFPSTEDGEGRDETYGVAKGYVRIRESYQGAEGTSDVFSRAYDKKGNLIKEVEIWKSSDGYVSKTTTKNTYDKKGNLTKQVVYYNDYVRTSTFTYNKAGKVTKEVHKSVYEDNSVFKTSTAYTYNKAGNVAKEVSYYDDCESVTVYTYNKAGLPVKETVKRSYEDNTKTVITTNYAYDKNGNMTKLTFAEKDRYGSAEKRVYVYTYNEKNLCVKMKETWTFRDKEGSAETTRDVTTYAYDKNGNVTKQVYKSVSDSGEKRTVTFLYTYDENGNRTEWVTTEESGFGNSKETVTYTYKAGRLVKETVVSEGYDGAGKTTETYTYDKAGNLTKYVYAYQYPGGEKGKNVTTYRYQKIGA